MPRRKRSRTSLVVGSRRARPIDKQVIAINSQATGSTQVRVVLIGAVARSGTVTGLSWDFCIRPNGTGGGVCMWAIIHEPHGSTLNGLTLTTASSIST